jgi:hypothetical protein
MFLCLLGVMLGGWGGWGGGGENFVCVMNTEHTLLVMLDRVKGGGPHPHQAGLILPSRWNVRQKVVIATLCVLCGDDSGVGGGLCSDF